MDTLSIERDKKFSMATERQPKAPGSKGHWLAVAGALMQIAPVLGMVGTSIKLVQAIFTIIDTSGIADPSQLSAAIGEALIKIFVSMLIALFGAVLLLIAVFSMRFRSWWMFWILMILGLFYLLAIPLGTIIGVVFLVTALKKRKEFFQSSGAV